MTGVEIAKPGDSKDSVKEMYSRSRHGVLRMREIKARGGVESVANPLILGVSDVALTTTSWLSSASFQNTTRVLISASTKRSD